MDPGTVEALLGTIYLLEQLRRVSSDIQQHWKTPTLYGAASIMVSLHKHAAGRNIPAGGVFDSYSFYVKAMYFEAVLVKTSTTLHVHKFL